MDNGAEVRSSVFSDFTGAEVRSSVFCEFTCPARMFTHRAHIMLRCPQMHAAAAQHLSFSTPQLKAGEETVISRRFTSPWALVTQTLSDALSPRQRAHKTASRLSVAAQQAFSGALQVAIARHPILSTISSEVRRGVAAACMQEVKVRAGAVVAAQGAECDAPRPRP